MYKMSEIVNKFLLARDKFMSEMHLKHPGYTYSACGPFTKYWKIEKFIPTGNTYYIYKNYLDKACLQHDMAYSKYKDLNKRTQSDNVLRDKAFEIVSKSKFCGYQRDLASMVYKFFDKTSKGKDVNFVSNQQPANELHKPIIRKFKRRKVHSSFNDKIWGADLVDMQLISKYNKGIRYFLCVIDLVSKYAWTVPLKDKNVITIVNAFQSILDSSKRKPNKIRIDECSEFYHSFFKKIVKREWHRNAFNAQWRKVCCCWKIY